MFRIYFPENDDFLFSPLPKKIRRRDCLSSPFDTLLLSAPKRKRPLESLLKESIEERQIGEQNLKNLGVDDGKKWAFVVDTSDFSPAQLKVSVDDSKRTVSVEGDAKWESRDGTRKRASSFCQTVQLPETVKLDTVKTRLLGGGKLALVADKQVEDVQQQSAVREIPIEVVRAPVEERQGGKADEEVVEVEKTPSAKTKERNIQLE